MTPPDEPINLPEDLMNQDPDGHTQPIASSEPPPVTPPTAPYEQPYGQPAYGQPPYGQPDPGAQPPYGQPAYGQPDPGAQPPYGQPAYGQPGYGQPPYGQPAYGQPGYAWAPTPAVPNHPQAQTAMVLGLVGLIGTFVCGITIFLCPFAWVMGSRAKKEIDASGGAYGGRDQAQVGYVTGLIGTVLLALGLIALVFVIGLAVVGGASVDSGGY